MISLYNDKEITIGTTGKGLFVRNKNEVRNAVITFHKSYKLNEDKTFTIRPQTRMYIAIGDGTNDAYISSLTFAAVRGDFDVEYPTPDVT